MIEAQHFSFIRANQKLICCDILNGLQEAVNIGETDPSPIGRRIVLPTSFTGGTRYMFNNCQDAMAICKKFGYPDLFITITCNVNWSEIRDFVSSRGLSTSDRPDIMYRVFKMKLDQMMTNLKKKGLLRKDYCRYVLYAILYHIFSYSITKNVYHCIYSFYIIRYVHSKISKKRIIARSYFCG